MSCGKVTLFQKPFLFALLVFRLEQLEAQQEDVVESDPTDSLDEDYRPILHMPPHAHDREASGSSLAPP